MKVASGIPYGYVDAEAKLSKCKNTAFADTVQNFHQYLMNWLPKRSRKRNSMYFLSKDDSMVRKSMWLTYSRYLNPSVLRRLMSTLESGIYNYWRELLWFPKIIQHLKVPFPEDFLPQGLKSNIVTVFWVYGILFGTAVIVFLAECGFKLMKYIVHFITKVIAKFKLF